MKIKLIALLCLMLLCSHDMYLKMEGYFIEPNEEATIHLYNGTFERSENVIDRDRMLDASLLGNGKRFKITDDQWTEKDSITILNFVSGESGTWVAGVSTKARSIELGAEDFNNYLEHDGVTDMLEWRRENNVMDQDAVEKYSKHVKAIFQVGDKRTYDWSTSLGYPIEFIPLKNPYDLHTGDTLAVKLLRDGKPLVNQLVYADHVAAKHGHSHTNKEHSHASEDHSHDTSEHSHDETEHSHEKEETTDSAHGHTHEHEDGTVHSHKPATTNDDHHHDASTKNHSHESSEEATVSESHTHTTGQELRTNNEGIVNVTLSEDGIWYLRTIHLVTTDEADLTHESNWATLTFEITHSHNTEDGADHTHEEDGGIPSYVFWLVSLLIVGGLFLWFNKKK